MNRDTANPNIKCTVKQCQNHCATEDYCALDSINVGTHEPNPKMCQCVDCESFVAKS